MRWTDEFSDEDLNFLKRFILASGSLKDLAGQYGVSYPTIRLRLDRVIEKVRLFDSNQAMGEFEKAVRAKHIEGKIDAETMKQLLVAHKQEMEAHDESGSDQTGSGVLGGGGAPVRGRAGR